MPAGYSQAVSVEANGVKTIYISGQIGEGESLAEQSRNLYASMAKRLAAVGASAADVVKLVTFIVDYTPEKVGDAFAGYGGVFTDSDAPPAHTVVGVQALFQPQLLIEVEAVAVVAVG